MSTINLEPDWQGLAEWHKNILVSALRTAKMVERGYEEEWLTTALDVILYARQLDKQE